MVTSETDDCNSYFFKFHYKTMKTKMSSSKLIFSFMFLKPNCVALLVYLMRATQQAHLIPRNKIMVIVFDKEREI
jgi:hypothetical protein